MTGSNLFLWQNAREKRGTNIAPQSEGFSFKYLDYVLLHFSQLRLHSWQQERVSGVETSHGRRVSRQSNHQLGRHPVGEETPGIVDRPGDSGDNIVDRDVVTRLSGIQGTSITKPSIRPFFAIFSFSWKNIFEVLH